MEPDREEQIRVRAYEIWEREGRKEGRHEAHWQQAERELSDEQAGGAGSLGEGTLGGPVAPASGGSGASSEPQSGEGGRSAIGSSDRTPGPPAGMEKRND